MFTLMEKDVKERIKKILADFSLNPTQLSKMFNVNQKTLNSQINQSTTLSVSTILLILEAIPSLSAEWLLRGVGEPLLDNSASKEGKYFEMCKMLLENRKKETELYLKLAGMVGKEEK